MVSPLTRFLAHGLLAAYCTYKKLDVTMRLTTKKKRPIMKVRAKTKNYEVNRDNWATDM